MDNLIKLIRQFTTHSSRDRLASRRPPPSRRPVSSGCSLAAAAALQRAVALKNAAIASFLSHPSAISPSPSSSCSRWLICAQIRGPRRRICRLQLGLRCLGPDLVVRCRSSRRCQGVRGGAAPGAGRGPKAIVSPRPAALGLGHLRLVLVSLALAVVGLLEDVTYKKTTDVILDNKLNTRYYLFMCAFFCVYKLQRWRLR